jgi:hypothetical protein
MRGLVHRSQNKTKTDTLAAEPNGSAPLIQKSVIEQKSHPSANNKTSSLKVHHNVMLFPRFADFPTKIIVSAVLDHDRPKC